MAVIIAPGYQDGPRQPMMLISPWAKTNAVDHTLTDLSSVTRFIEDNWALGQIPGSFDAIAGPLTGMLDLTNPTGAPPNPSPLLLDPATGPPLPRPRCRWPPIPESKATPKTCTPKCHRLTRKAPRLDHRPLLQG